VQRSATGSLDVRFTLVDGESQVPVAYRGVLPDLFAEGKGAIAQGKLDASGTLIATEVLAKHDENYAPPPGKGHPGGLPNQASPGMGATSGAAATTGVSGTARAAGAASAAGAAQK
jgi:cytochrome c-type biogenesis protein CcmE